MRAPNYVEQYINFTREPQRGRNYGNPDLKVEKAWTSELGIDFYPTKSLTLNATVFQRTTSNLIDFAMLDRNVQFPTLADSVLLAQNIAEINTRGFELETNLRHQIGRQQLNLNASLTHLDTELEDVLESAVFKYASSHARNLVQSTLQWLTPSFNLGVQALWKEKLDDDTYGIINLRGEIPFDVGARQVSVSLEVRNLFDEQYSEVLDAPMPGRWILFGAKVNI